MLTLTILLNTCRHCWYATEIIKITIQVNAEREQQAAQAEQQQQMAQMQQVAQAGGDIAPLAKALPEEAKASSKC